MKVSAALMGEYRSLAMWVCNNLPTVRHKPKVFAAFKKHANLELDYGAHLRDPKGRVEGVGKNIRHIMIRSLEEVDADYFVDLIRQSLEYHRNH